ncbi:MAG: zinc ribbon domain-containing protein [Acidobacteria bacterium]|nr:zinc ribbon domain-containing protein [Acidobacteriota bacterium]
MPTYEYTCEECGHRLEEFQSITAPPLTECPQCHGRLTRLVGTGSCVIFRSGGRPDSSARPVAGDSCAYAETGRTCCGRKEPCHE